MIANCSPCSSCRRQVLVCTCGEKLSNTRPVSQAAGYLQVLQVMKQWQWLRQTHVEIRSVFGSPWKQANSPGDPVWEPVQPHAGPQKPDPDQSFPSKRLNTMMQMSFGSRCLPGRMEPAGQGMNLSNPFSWLIPLAGSSREHPLSHGWMLFYLYLFNMLMLSRTFIPPLLSIALSSGFQEYDHGGGLSRGFRFTPLWGHWRNELVNVLEWAEQALKAIGRELAGHQGCT